MGDDLPLLNSTYASVVVRSIAKDDAERGTDNYQFLYEYLMCERRANIVAEKLHMHRNNVKYRIDRIEGAYGIDTSNPLFASRCSLRTVSTTSRLCKMHNRIYRRR